MASAPAQAWDQRRFISFDPGFGVFSDDAASCKRQKIKGNVVRVAEVGI